MRPKVGEQSADSANLEFSTVQSAAADRIIGGGAALSALMVDDEAHVRSPVRVVLHSLSVTEVREAADALEALRLYREKQPSVVFLDVNMPTMSGEKALAKLMEIDPDAAVVIVTSHNEIGTVRRSQELDAVGYVSKHARRQEFTETLQDLLDGLVAHLANE